MDGNGSNPVYTMEGYQRTLEHIERTEGDLRAWTEGLETLRNLAQIQREFLIRTGVLNPERGEAFGVPYPRGMDGVLLVLLDFHPTFVDTSQLLERAQVCDAIDGASRHGASTLGSALRRLAARGLTTKSGRRWGLTEAGHAAAREILEYE